ncbi:MAG TPA: hypothetical protein EYN72_00675 [Dehalococcoidia bacterium]|nr:hypothetical protein [Dehalococcoidia bacterium]
MNIAGGGGGAGTFVGVGTGVDVFAGVGSGIGMVATADGASTAEERVSCARSGSCEPHAAKTNTAAKMNQIDLRIE